jgi:1,4-dihydroxy-6-naphthoate synthase
LEHQDDALDYAMKYSRGKPAELIRKFVNMYVNNVTVEMGQQGENSIRHFFDLAIKKKLVPPFELKINTR